MNMLQWIDETIDEKLFSFQLVDGIRKGSSVCVSDKRMTGSGVIDDVLHEVNIPYFYLCF